LILFRKIGYAGLVLALSLGIFYFLVKDQQVKTDILRTTLELFGEQLLDMVPAGEPRHALTKKYDDFLQKTEKDEIAPEDIEQIAANILNITTQDTIVSVEVALNALEVCAELSGTVEISTTTSPVGPVAKGHPLKIFERNPPEKFFLEKPEREELARELRELHELSIHIRESSKHDSAYKDVQDQLLFLADSGLKVAMSIDLKETIPKAALLDLQKKLHRLERDKMIEWREDMRIKHVILVESLLDIDEFDEYMHPSQFLAGQGVFRHIGPIAIDSLATVNPDSFKSLLNIHIIQMKKSEQRRKTADDNN
jgi:hypothetical protein